MKNLIAVCSLALLLASSAGAQMPIFRNQFTTNVPGAYVRGNVDFGTVANWARFNGSVGVGTNASVATVQVHGTVQSTNFLLIVPQWDDVRIPMATLSSPSSAPGRKIFVGGLTTYAFDDNADEQLDFELQVPHGISTNNDWGIHIHIHWTATNAIGANSNVVWGIEFTEANPGTGIFPATTTTMFATNGIGLIREHRTAEFAAVTNVVESSVIIGRIFRDADNAADTYVGDALGLSLDAHYPRIKMGSTLEYGDY